VHFRWRAHGFLVVSRLYFFNGKMLGRKQLCVGTRA
jgi:hypothetical protein